METIILAGNLNRSARKHPSKLSTRLPRLYFSTHDAIEKPEDKVLSSNKADTFQQWCLILDNSPQRHLLFVLISGSNNEGPFVVHHSCTFLTGLAPSGLHTQAQQAHNSSKCSVIIGRLGISYMYQFQVI